MLNESWTEASRIDVAFRRNLYLHSAGSHRCTASNRYQARSVPSNPVLPAWALNDPFGIY